jgi:predicted ATPase
MLIAIAGSQGSGKTRLLSALSGTNVYHVERKTSRSILSDWGVSLSQVNNDYDLTIKFQDEIFKRKLQDDLFGDRDAQADIKQRTSYLPKTQEFVVFTERTLIDLLVYSTVTLGKDNQYSDWLDQYAGNCIRATVDTYDHVFYLKGGLFKVEADGTRGHNQYYSQMVDAAMLSFYKAHIPYEQLTVITTADIDERVDIVNNRIKLLS